MYVPLSMVNRDIESDTIYDHLGYILSLDRTLQVRVYILTLYQY